MGFIQFLGKFVVFVNLMSRAYNLERTHDPDEGATCMHDIPLNNLLTTMAHIVNKAQYHFTKDARGTAEDPVGCHEVPWKPKYGTSATEEYFWAKCRKHWPNGQMHLGPFKSCKL